MKVKSVLFFFVFIQLLFASFAYSAENTGTTVVQMDKAETIIYGEAKRGGLIERLNELETVLFGRSLPGSISERQLQLINFIETGSDEQPSLLFKLGVAEWAVSQTIQPFVPALGRLQKLEQELDGFIQEGKPMAMRVERLLSMLLTDPVTQVELEVSSDKIVRAQFLDDIGPGKSRKGDSVKMELLEDFTIENHLIAPKGSRIVSEVSEVKRPAAFGRPGEVKLDLKYLQILGPEEVKVKVADTTKRFGERGEGNIAAAAGASIVGAVLLGPLGLASGLLIRGQSLDVNAGTQFYIELADRAKMSVFPIPPGLRKNDESSEGTSVSRSSSNSEEVFIPDQ
ncbi:MAG: hypothetical protein FWE49_01000 [Synergistaceae bacterium]|nr:hypothetical protein [Synergistaceae bacterium]